MLSSCVSFIPYAEPARHVNTQELLLNEDFANVNNWLIYNTPDYTVNIIDESYQFLSSVVGQYIWGTNGLSVRDTVIETDITWVDSGTTTLAGVACRLNTSSGLGYYLLVSSDGNFSIRYTGRNRDTPLVNWQYRRAIPQTGTFRMRAVCADDYLGLYINERYIEGVTDDNLSDGEFGLVMGIPPRASGSASVIFDNVQIWSARLVD